MEEEEGAIGRMLANLANGHVMVAMRAGWKEMTRAAVVTSEDTCADARQRYEDIVTIVVGFVPIDGVRGIARTTGDDESRSYKYLWFR